MGELRIPRVGVAVIVTRYDSDFIQENNRYLLGKRGPDSKRGRGQWSIPGGAMEFGESVACTAERELKEETGLELNVVAPTWPRRYTEAVFEDEHWITLYVLSTAQSDDEPKIMEPGKCDKWVWLTLKEIKVLPLFPPLQKYLEKYGRLL